MQWWSKLNLAYFEDPESKINDYHAPQSRETMDQQSILTNEQQATLLPPDTEQDIVTSMLPPMNHKGKQRIEISEKIKQHNKRA